MIFKQLQFIAFLVGLIAVSPFSATESFAFGSKPLTDPSVKPSGTPTGGSGLNAGQFDSYVLAVTYQNEYCQFNPTEAECTVNPVPSGLGLHGLWPNRDDDLKDNYQYCGPSQSSLGKNWWCRSDLDIKSKLSPAEFDELYAVMPGVASCLYNHEWYAHGTCSGLTTAQYFDESTILATRFRQLKNIQAVLSQMAGQTVDRDVVFNAIIADLGPKAADAARVNCFKEKGSGLMYFSEIDVGLDRVRYMDFPSQDSLYPLKPYLEPNGQIIKDKGSCPETGIVISK